MSYPKKGRPGGFRHHERPADPAEEADRPLEPKAPPEGEPLESTGARSVDPHHRLNNPVGEPDPDADSDPYQPHPEAEDPPPPGQFPGPGPEPDLVEDEDEPGFAR
ncbi:MAG: hypothetical protein H0U12_03110 [Thermoleophilaceae bacterium]|jgi:hypothetical protein|nr:hypothetical protein [Thermoleophilaceae bacterium]